MKGLKITSLSPLTRTELDGEELAGQLFEAYLQQVLVDGFFHADPHPGNLSLTEDRRIALLDLGMVVLGVTRTASEHGVRIPGDLSMLGKTLLNLDRVGRTLDPEFDPNEAIRTHVAGILRQRMWKQASPGRVAASLLEMTDFMQELPTRLNRTLDLLANNRVRFRWAPSTRSI